ncbi:ribonuclease P protein component [Mycetocola zhujimingii]|uniref:Ribonuclease P protein component n=1 Tax=Mycetocola zhujimingii TaxID=2079792 RepID=A0A2U1TB56_9MICO|nr:ribonuclease P protein component [Mycetocola zhujimingii]AWB87797.1 ribonuclease P protein component [Mycetocola zhujimingii]PWC06013.1 ribonuclease P protein component [Mycetocola zhujimingii]
MLAQAQRITSADDYKRVVRRGRRAAGTSCVTYQLMNPNGGTPRFGFIVAKTVGNAVVRNRTRRRLKAIAHDLAPELPEGAEFVFRALPPAAVSDFSALKAELQHSTAKLVARS